jgi:hypothetical protein
LHKNTNKKLEDVLRLKFSQRFSGTIWNILADNDAIVVEVRMADSKQVSFTAINPDSGDILWANKVLEEPWWVNASAISRDLVLFTIYLDTNNPDKKGLLAYSMRDLSLQWWNNDFSLSEMGTNSLKGFTSRLGLKEVVLDLSTGKEISADHFQVKPASSNVRRPFQYHQETTHFDTVKTFLVDRLNFHPVSTLEYLEVDNRIVISAFCHESDGLANYLFVLSAEGNVLLKEKLEGPVKGIGLDTFFILNGCLIFVKNKVELVSYKII